MNISAILKYLTELRDNNNWFSNADTVREITICSILFVKV